MTVEPGFGGQSFMADMMGKVRRARELVDTGELDLVIQVDGGIARVDDRAGRRGRRRLLRRRIGRVRHGGSRLRPSSICADSRPDRPPALPSSVDHALQHPSGRGPRDMTAGGPPDLTAGAAARDPIRRRAAARPDRPPPRDRPRRRPHAPFVR